MNSPWPQIIKDVGFDFSWDNKKVWAIDAPVTEIDINELTWHFDIPFLGKNGGVYNLTPREVLGNTEIHPEEYERTRNADISYPIDIMENKGRWLILDGLHRLMRLSLEGAATVRVRIIPRSYIPRILKTK